jgi:hypothetical protein
MVKASAVIVRHMRAVIDTTTISHINVRSEKFLHGDRTIIGGNNGKSRCRGGGGPLQKYQEIRSAGDMGGTLVYPIHSSKKVVDHQGRERR